MHCEEKKGNVYTNLHKLINDDDFKYYCANCREKKLNKNPNEMLKKKRNKSHNQNCNLFFYNSQINYY